MKFKNLLILFFIALTFQGYSQDTIKVGTSIMYSSEEYPTRSKHFASIVKYAREDIVYSETKKRVEFCYYYDDVRNCKGDTYNLLNDSILVIIPSFADSSTETWKYFKTNEGNYRVERTYANFREMGKVNSLIPFVRSGYFVTKHVSSLDTLWMADYSNNDTLQPKGPKGYLYPKATIDGKIYHESKVDKLPVPFGKDSITEIALAKNSGCYSEPLTIIKTISFVVTSAGEVKNIEQYIGNVSLNYCPYYFMALMKEVLLLGPWNPGELNGEKVNVQRFLNIDMKDEQLNELVAHPAYNRKVKKRKRK